MSKFQAGNPGRPRGSRNKRPTRERIQKILSDPVAWQKFEDELFSLKGRAFTESFTRLFEFTTPRYQAQSLSLSSLPESDLRFLLEKIKQQEEEYATDN